MRQNTQLENSQVKLKTSDVTSPYENDLPVADLCGPVDFPPFQENKTSPTHKKKFLCMTHVFDTWIRCTKWDI